MNKKGLTRREFLKLSTMAGAGTLLAACAPTSFNVNEEVVTNTPEATEANKTLIRVWGGNKDITDTKPFFDRYTATHENVMFELLNQADYNAARLVLQSGSVDILLNNPGWAETDPLIRAGLLKDMDGYWDKYNWDDRFTDFGKANVSLNGKVYGTPNEQAFIACMYNAETFRKHGLTGKEDPQTYDEFIKILQVLKDGGEAPIISGLRGDSQTDMIFAPFVQAAVGRKGMEKLLFGDGKWTDPAIVEATNRMIALAKDGFIDMSGLALDYTEAIGRFLEGKNPIWTGGVWANAAISDAFGGSDNYGFFTIPPWDNSIPIGYPGGIGSLYSIAASSAVADTAADVLDSFFDEEALRIWVEDLKIFPPVKADFSKYALTPQQIKQTQVAQMPDGIGYWLVVYLPPDLLDLFKSGGAGLINGQITAEDWLAEMQAGWEKGLKEGTIPR